MSYDGPGIYRHYKGGEYEVIGLAVREETIGVPGRGEVTEVVYRPMEQCDRQQQFVTRVLEDFNERVRIPFGEGSAPGEQGRPGNSYVSRFEKIAKYSIPEPPAR